MKACCLPLCVVSTITLFSNAYVCGDEPFASVMPSRSASLRIEATKQWGTENAKLEAALAELSARSPETIIRNTKLKNEDKLRELERLAKDHAALSRRMMDSLNDHLSDEPKEFEDTPEQKTRSYLSKELVRYMDRCQSGSVAAFLKRVYAFSAAPPHHLDIEVKISPKVKSDN